MRKIILAAFLILMILIPTLAILGVPRQIIPPVYAGTVTPLPVNGILIDIITASSYAAYFIVGDYSDSLHTPATKCGGVIAASSLDVEAAGYVYGTTINPQNMVLDTNSAYVSQTNCGQPLVSPVLAVGGAVVNEVQYFYEVRDASSLIFFRLSGSYYQWVRRDTGAVVYQQAGASGTVDAFYIQAFLDSSGRKIFMIGGFTWRGTVAGALYVAHTVLRSSAFFVSPWYVYKWEDATSGPGKNNIPDDKDAFTIQGSGPSSASIISALIDNALNLGWKAMDRLYKGHNALGSGISAVSEYEGFPLSIYNSYYSSIGGRVRAGDTSRYSTITVNNVGAAQEDFEYNFWDATQQSIIIKIGVHIDFSSKQIKAIFRNDFNQVSSPTTVYLEGSTITTSFSSGNVGATVTKYYDPYGADRFLFRSFRYTMRHGSQMGYKLFQDHGWTTHANNLKNGLTTYGFTYDIYDPAFDVSYWQDFYKDYFYNEQCYHDCAVNPSLPDTPTSYPYRSKVCWNVCEYIYLSTHDWLVPTLQAIQQLVAHGPDWHYEAFKNCPLLPPCPPPYCVPVDRTPRSYARELEAKWNGVGIPSPASSTYASGMRTAVFGILETILGYTYGDTTSKAWAGTVRDVFLKVQVNALGYYASADLGGIAMRSLFAGMWFTAWDPYQQGVPRSQYDWLFDWAGMDPEYSGMVPGNMETLEITLQFFTVYKALTEY